MKRGEKYVPIILNIESKNDLIRYVLYIFIYQIIEVQDLLLIILLVKYF